MDTFSDRLKRARIARKLNKSQLARAIGVSPQRITQIENDGGEFSIGPFVKAARTLRVRAEWLALNEGEMESQDPAVTFPAARQELVLHLWSYLSDEQEEEWLKQLRATKDSNLAVAKHVNDRRLRHTSNARVEATLGLPQQMKSGHKTRR